jgi:hypothetical protein
MKLLKPVLTSLKQRAAKLFISIAKNTPRDLLYATVITIDPTQKNNWNIKYYPSRSKQRLQFRIASNACRNAVIHIQDLLGNPLKTIWLNGHAGHVDMSDVTAQTYTVKYADSTASFATPGNQQLLSLSN